MRGVWAVLLFAVLAVAPSAAAAPSRLAFTSPDGIDVINADGSGRAPLFHPPEGRFVFAPAWSPDAKRIAYVSGTESADEGELTAVWTMAADGSDQRRLRPRRKASTLDSSPAWSPDGRAIAFARTRYRGESLTTSLVVAAADGSAERTILSQPSRKLLGFEDVRWSPDGTRLLYARYVVDRLNYVRLSLRSIAADGSDPRLIARGAGDASFSPDGKEIAFVSIRDRNGYTCGSDECFYHGEIYVAAADGSGARRLTASKAHDLAPVWSPDGARIAFASDRNFPFSANHELYTIGVDGSCLTWLTNGTGANHHPAWEPGPGSSDPGACGDAGRAPLFSTDLTPVRQFRFATPYWLGRETAGHMLLAHVEQEGRALFLSYDDCSRYRPKECSGATNLYVEPVCRRERELYRDLGSARATRFRGALLLRPRRPRGSARLIAGTTHVDVFVERAAAMPLVRELRAFDGDTPAARFPRPALPRTLWRRAGRIERAFREHGRRVGRTARALGAHRSYVRKSLRVARRLRSLGPVDRTGC